MRHLQGAVLVRAGFEPGRDDRYRLLAGGRVQEAACAACAQAHRDVQDVDAHPTLGEVRAYARQRGLPVSRESG